MSKRKKIAAIIGGSLAGLLLLLVVTSLIIVQTPWFANYVREKIIATVQQSTGGTVELRSFEFDPWHLTVRIRNFILHGTEPPSAHPLARISLLEIHLKLFSGIAHTVDLAYVGIEQPQVNLIVFPDGKTNVPAPKNPTPSSKSNPLQSIVDLKIGQFRIDNGLLEYAQQATSFSGQGRNLRAVLNYNTLNPSYAGNLAIDPLVFAQGSRPPIEVHLNVPVTIDGNAVQFTNATLATSGSKVVVNASLAQLNAPLIDATVNASIGLPEWQRSFDLPIDVTSRNAPHELSAEISAHLDRKQNVLTLKTAHLALGRTTFQASGALQNPADPSAAAQFNADLALDELSRLFKVTSPQTSGNVLVNGTAKLDAQNNYQVNGVINSRDLSLRQAGTRISDVKLYTPFHADPYLISLDRLKLNAFGGSLDAKIFIEKLKNLSVEGSLQNLSLPVLAASFTGKHLGYDGTLSGTLRARGDLKAKGTSGYSAAANLSIGPGNNGFGNRGVPVNGKINATYAGATGIADLGDSYVNLPHSRLTLSGALNHQLNVKLVSTNLNDFLPAANFGAKQPQTSLPVSLQPGGSATVDAAVTGDLASPQIAGNVMMKRFAAQGRMFDQASLDLAASPGNAAIRNGLLTRGDLRTNFDASIGLRKWSPVPSSPLAANVSVRNASVPDLLSLAGQSSVPATGTLTADVHVHGTYGDPLGSANVQVANGIAYNERFSRILAQVNLSHDLISLAPLQVATDAGTVNVTGTYRHPSDSFLVGDAAVHVTSDALQLGKLNAVTGQSPGAGGTLQISADGALTVREVKKQTSLDIQNVSADVNGRGLRWNNQSAGDLMLTARTANKTVTYQLTSNFAGSNIDIRGHSALTPGYNTVADLNIQRLQVEKALAIAGQGTVPASGTLSAQAHVAGTMKAPQASLTFALSNANVYQERVDRLSGDLRYSDTLIDVRSLQLQAPAGTVDLAASFRHPMNDFKTGAADVNIKTSDIDLARIEHLHQAQPTLRGRVHLVADAAADLRDAKGKQAVLVRRVNADARTQALSLQNHDLGEAALAASTSGSTVDFHFDSDIAHSQIHANGKSQLATDYPTNASVTFANIRYSNIAPFLSTDPATAPSFEALVEGQASVNGPVLDLNALTGRLRLNRLEASTARTKSPTGGAARRGVSIQNQGPIVVALDKSILTVEQMHIGGTGAKLDATGTAGISGPDAPMNLRVGANLDLGILQDVDRQFYSEGSVVMDAAVHGTLTQPLVNGRIDLKNASVNYAQAPNGISNANGSILLNGTGATIQSLTAESGGGKIALTGFAGLSGQALAFNLKAQANKVRVRYSGISATSDATVTLTGTTRRSLLAGNVTVTRIAYNSSSDAGSLLSGFASTPPSTASAPSPILAGLRLDVHVLTAPDLRVVTTYANRLAVEANLTLRGTGVSPGMVGHVVVTDGQLVFFGNTYTVNTGNINFYDPNSIQPVINIGLETLAQGVDVTLNVAGPMSNLQLSYTSDPPLTFEQIVQLLATNTTPNDPNVVANQPPAPQQSFTQMGESAILGQAVANPLASRVQRVFGLSQFKIDPSFTGSNGQPSARVTLQQKIANNITFTYITDVTQTNSEIVRVQWDLTPQLSAVGLRDYNGNVSIEMFYKFKVQ